MPGNKVILGRLSVYMQTSNNKDHLRDDEFYATGVLAYPPWRTNLKEQQTNKSIPNSSSYNIKLIMNFNLSQPKQKKTHKRWKHTETKQKKKKLHVFYNKCEKFMREFTL